MVQNPPRDDVADVLFDYVNKYQSEITSEQWKLLKNSSFIPYEKVSSQKILRKFVDFF